jgi:glycosyltransferase involved in cell wall biosynthesis
VPRKKLPKKSNLPKISIVIPSFNKGRFIGETLQSIVDQKYPNIEIIIQDGGSTDNTVEVIKRFAKKYKYISWVSRKDKGQLDALCKGLKKAKGEILTYINADDIYSEDSLFKVAKAFTDDSNASWVTGFGNIINDDGKKVSGIVTNYKNNLIRLNNYKLLLMVNYLTQPATFISRNAYKKYGPFTGSRNCVMEYELWLKLGKVEMPKVVNQTLASFRLSQDSLSATSFKKILTHDNKIAKKYTQSRALLFLHNLHNEARIRIITS